MFPPIYGKDSLIVVQIFSVIRPYLVSLKCQMIEIDFLVDLFFLFFTVLIFPVFIGNGD